MNKTKTILFSVIAAFFINMIIIVKLLPGGDPILEISGIIDNELLKPLGATEDTSNDIDSLNQRNGEIDMIIEALQAVQEVNQYDIDSYVSKLEGEEQREKTVDLLDIKVIRKQMVREEEQIDDFLDEWESDVSQEELESMEYLYRNNI